MNVKGLTIQDIMNIDLDAFNRMNEKDLRSVTSRLVSAGNKRIRRLESKNINTPAYQSLGDIKSFSTKLNKDLSKQQRVNQLRKEFAKARNFLSSQTSTIGGYKKFKKQTISRLSRELNITEKTINEKLNVERLFDKLHKYQSLGYVSSYRGSKGSLQARNMIADILIHNPNISDDDLEDYFENAFDDWYEQQEMESIEDIDDETDEFEF